VAEDKSWFWDLLVLVSWVHYASVLQFPPSKYEDNNSFCITAVLKIELMIIKWLKSHFMHGVCIYAQVCLIKQRRLLYNDTFRPVEMSGHLIPAEWPQIACSVRMWVTTIGFPPPSRCWSSPLLPAECLCPVLSPGLAHLLHKTCPGQGNECSQEQACTVVVNPHR
jgi:hypothetical protein